MLVFPLISAVIKTLLFISVYVLVALSMEWNDLRRMQSLIRRALGRE